MISAGLGVLPIMQAGGWRTINVVARFSAVAKRLAPNLISSVRFPHKNQASVIKSFIRVAGEMLH